MTKIKSPALVAKEARIAQEKAKRAAQYAQWNAQWSEIPVAPLAIAADLK